MATFAGPAARAQFPLRLAATLVLTTTAVGAAQYVLAGQALTARVLAHGLEGHRADAEVLRTLHRPGTPDPLAEAAPLLGHMAARPGLDSAVLLSPDGTVALRGAAHSAPMGAQPSEHAADAAGPAHSGAGTAHGMTMPEAPVPPADLRVAQPVLEGGPAAAEHLASAGRVLHAVPVDLDGARHVLLVARSDAPLEAQVASVRRVLLLTLAIGAALALPLFFLVGGRGLAARHRQAVDASTRDGLTGLGNHRWFHERLAAVVEAGGSGAAPLCLALVDLDGFKQVNDSEGHRRGDEVLASVSRVLLAAAPGHAFRVGGDEFALLLPGPLTAATATAEEVRTQVALLRLGVTTSIGVAPLVPASGAQPLWDAADAALYAAKRGGRNRVVADGSTAVFATA